MDAPVFIDISDDGVVATHPVHIDFPKQVAPATAGESNRIGDMLIAIGCANIPDQHFEFDSSFILPQDITRDRMKKFAEFFESQRDTETGQAPALSIFGHADPVGKDDYNKTLSGRRALSLYGLLTRDTEIWEDLYKHPFGGDNWGTRSLQVMLEALGFAPGRADGVMDAATRQAVRDFQLEHGLKDDGDPGPITRKELFLAYMDFLCTFVNDQGQVINFSVKETDFLAQGKGPDRKGDIQGCGEFNPILLFSAERDREFSNPAKKKERDEANAPNRRVLIFLFKPGTLINPGKWPCPTVTEGAGGCKKRFWSDGEARRTRRLPDEDREFKKTEDTFGCRFYHGFAFHSPCEGNLRLWVIRLALDDTMTVDAGGAQHPARPLAKRRFVITAGSVANAPVIHGRTDADGVLRIPVFDEATDMLLKVDAVADLTPAGEPIEGEADEDKFFRIKVRAGNLQKFNGADPLPFKQRLYNLGYGSDKVIDQWDNTDFIRALNAFQRTHGLPETDAPDEATRRELEATHGS
jgi:outer membrane protein OmpA-like peptidoglycan-associated protein